MKAGYKAVGVMLLLIMSNMAYSQNWIEKLDLNQYEGKVIYLDFWASWCGPCRKSFPWLNEMEERYNDKDLVIIGVNLDTDIALANQFLESVPASFKLFSDPDGHLAERYKLIGMPSSFVIDRHGEVRHRHVGFKKSDIASYEASIKALLNEPFQYVN